MPLGADVVDLADQALLDLIDRVVVQHAVVPLMADGEDDRIAVRVAELLGGTGHFLALADVVGHQLFGEHMLALAHRGERGRMVQVQGQGDDHRFDVRIVEQFLVAVVVDLDVLLGGVAIGPALRLLVDVEQTGAGRVSAWRIPVAVERAVDAVGANVGDAPRRRCNRD